MCRYDMPESRQLLDRFLESEEAARARIGLVTAHNPCPLLGAHRARSGVGQEIDEHVRRRESEEVVPRLLEQGGPLVAGGHTYRFNRLDLERLDDRLEAVRHGHVGGGKRSPATWSARAAHRFALGSL